MLNATKSVRYKIKSFFLESLGFSKHTKRLNFRNFRLKFVKISDCKAFSLFNDEKENDQEGTRTLYRSIRRRKPFPLGHAANRTRVKNLLLCIVRRKNSLVNVYVC